MSYEPPYVSVPRDPLGVPYLIAEVATRGFRWLHIRGDGTRELTEWVPWKCAYYEQPEYDIETGYCPLRLRIGHEGCQWIKENHE